MSKRSFAVIISCLLVTATAAVIVNGRASLGREELLADVRQLAHTLETVHPDPYLRGGGKVAFHRRLHETLAVIPAEGMNRDAFYRLLQPLVAAVGDAHTWLDSPYMCSGPGGIPLYFRVVEDGFYVHGVPRADQTAWLGSRLIAVEGVPAAQIVARQAQRMPPDNHYLLLRNLGRAGDLWWRCHLQDLLPEWQDKGRICVTLRHPDNQVREHVLDVPSSLRTGDMITPDSRVELPSRARSDFVYDFLDPERRAALLVVDGMMSYREAFEMWRALGVHSHEDRTREIYQRYHDRRPPRGLDEVIADLPSATELFGQLVREMEEAGTEVLLIDLRRNGGGNSYMTEILLYYLYGKEAMIARKAGMVEVRRLSALYFDSFDGTLADLNTGRAIPLELGDYDFDGDFGHVAGIDRAVVAARMEETVSWMPTFGAEWAAGTYEAHYRPRHVVVLCSPHTFSSGYTLMAKLYQMGALVVGTPSAQSGNCFGDILRFTLHNSGLRFSVSRKWFEMFPGDPAAGELLQPHYQITWEDLRGYDFDPNAEILFTLDLLQHRTYTPTVESWEQEWNDRQPPERVMNAVGIRPGMTVVEFGAGRGRYAVQVAARVGPEGKVYAEDIDADALAHVERRCARDGIDNIAAVLGSVTDPKLPPASCDFAYCINTYHHIERPVPLLRNLSRALQPTGRLVIIEHTPEKVGADFSWHCTPPDSVIGHARAAGYELVTRYSFLELDEIYVFRVLE